MLSAIEDRVMGIFRKHLPQELTHSERQEWPSRRGNFTCSMANALVIWKIDGTGLSARVGERRHFPRPSQ